MKISLKKIEVADLEKIMQWRMNPNVTMYMNTDPKLTLDDQRKWFEALSRDDTKKMWKINVDGTDIGIVGMVDIDYTNRRTSWIWYIGDDAYRGKGIGKIVQLNLFEYVFNYMKLHRIHSEVLMFNEQGQGVHSKYGYEVEGVMKDHVYKNGKYIDVAVFGITVDKWNAIKDKFVYERITFDD